MRAIAATLLCLGTLAATAAPSVGQAADTEVPLTVITNEEFCELLSTDPLICGGIITGMATARVVPQAFADLVAGSPGDTTGDDTTDLAPVDDGAVGDTLTRDDLTITLLRADWKPDSSDAFFKPAKGNKYVSVLVEYAALEDDAYYDINAWDATDGAGNRYMATVLGPITPDLKVGNLAAGETVKGWVTYEVPKGVEQLRVIESQVLKSDLAWEIQR